MDKAKFSKADEQTIDIVDSRHRRMKKLDAPWSIRVRAVRCLRAVLRNTFHKRTIIVH